MQLKPTSLRFPTGSRIRYNTYPQYFGEISTEERRWKEHILEYLPLIEQHLLDGFEMRVELGFQNILRVQVVATSDGRQILTKEYRRLLPKKKGRGAPPMMRPARRVARSFARIVRAQGLSERKTRHAWESD